MGRLKLMRFYLVGPMDHDREAGKPWREAMTEWLYSRGALPIDPYHKPMRSIHAEALEDEDGYLERRSIAEQLKTDPYNISLRARLREITKPVVHTDLRVVDNADCIVCNLDVANRPCGTYDELFTAADQNKPIIIYSPGGIHNIPPWIWGRIPHEFYFDCWGAVRKYLDHIDTAPDHEIDLLKRWKFFDWEPMVAKALQA